MFSLLPVEFRQSAIEGRGVFAKKAFSPGEIIVVYAPKHERLAADDPRATEAAATRLTLFTQDGCVLVPDQSAPGGWLCNHSCAPNAALFSSGDGRVQCTRPIARGDEVTIFYGWVTCNGDGSAPCRCGAPACRGAINFDVGDEDAANVRIENGQLVVGGGGGGQGTTLTFYARDAAYATAGSYLGSPFEFVRKPDGTIGWIRVNGRIAARST